MDQLTSTLVELQRRVEDLEPASTHVSSGNLKAAKLLIVCYAPFCMAIPTIVFSALSGLVFEAVPALASIGLALYILFVGPVFNDMEGGGRYPLRDAALKAGATFTAATTTIATLKSGALDTQIHEFVKAVLFSVLVLGVAAPWVYRHVKREHAKANSRTSPDGPKPPG